MSRIAALTLVGAALAGSAWPSAAFAQEQEQSGPASLVSEVRLKTDVERLVAFGTRHTLSSTDDPRRGIGAARRWTENRFRKLARECGGCLQVALPETVETGDRLPHPAKIVNVLAVQRGTERPNEVVIIAGHIDSRASDVMDATSDAPGANDDGSGTVAVLEAARVLSRERLPTTIVYAVLSGEEQGLFGGKLLANYAKAQGWVVKAMLNNDIIGNSRGSDGTVDAGSVRVFSEGSRADGDDALRAAAYREGGENDSPSRNLSRWLDALADRSGIGIDVRQIFRADRSGRGGDHLPMLAAGYSAVRFSVGVENYQHQHQDVRTENGIDYGDLPEVMDFAYLAKVARLNVAALAALARAPMPPAPMASGAVDINTTLAWHAVPGAQSYRVYRRATDARDWSALASVDGDVTGYVAKGIRIDDWVFGVSSVASDGSESPVASAIPGGAFHPTAE
ncbi:MAG: M20/M25/M40 family metallo-hydrolase [Sphingobium sp.]